MKVSEFKLAAEEYLMEARNASLVDWWYSIVNMFGPRAAIKEIRQFVRNRCIVLRVELTERQVYDVARFLFHDFLY